MKRLELDRNPSESLPTARDEHRGQVRMVSGNGSSTKDELWLGRNDAGSNEWVKVANADDITSQGATAETLTNKTISGNTNTISIQDNKFTLFDNADATKQVQFDLVNISPGTTRVLILPNVTAVEVVATTATQTLTNKTLTAPTLNTPTLNDAILGNAVETTGTTPGIAANANAGATGAVSITGNDTVMRVTVTPGGAGIAAGIQATVSFAAARPDINYGVWMQPNSADAAIIGPTNAFNRTVNGFDIAVASVPASAAYTWFVLVIEF